MRGRKPQPIEQREREGNTQKKPLPSPVLIAGRPELEELAEPPSHLPKDAKAFWRDSVVRLTSVGIIDRVDVPVLEQLSIQYARIRQAQRRINRDGLFSRGSQHQLREHPAVRIEREATRTFLALAEQYALTPVARTRLGLAELHRRSLSQELTDRLGPAVLEAVE